MEKAKTEYKKVEIKQMFQMFVSFFKIGLFTFGGGYAMIPLIENEIVDKKAWIKSEDMIDMIAVSESIPGSIAINFSTLIGYRLYGIVGAIVAILGVVLPSFLIITIIAALSSNFYDNPIIKAAFLGVRCAVVGLIIKSAGKIIKSTGNSLISKIIIVGTIILILFTNVHAIFVILLGGLVGIVLPKLNFVINRSRE